MTVPTPPPRLIRYLAVPARWLLIGGVVFALTFTVGQYLIDQLMRKTYAATAVIQVLPNGGAGSALDLPAEVETLKSQKILMSVINDLGLDQAWARRVFNAKEDELTPSEALAYMGKILDVEVKPGTNQIVVTAMSDLPKEAADIANATADRYKVSRDAEEFQREASDNIPEALREQVIAQRKLFDEKRAALQKLTPGNSPEYLAAQVDFSQAENALVALNVKARQSEGNGPIEESHVRIVSFAEIPVVPVGSYFGLLLAVAIGLSVLAASFAEVLLLFSRAGERSGNY